MSIPAPVLLIR